MKKTAKLECPKGCNLGWFNAQQTIKNGKSVQKATCRGCGILIESKGGVTMGDVNTMTQEK